MVSLFKHFGRQRFQNGRSKPRKRYSQLPQTNEKMKKLLILYLFATLIPKSGHSSFLSAFRHLNKSLSETSTLKSFQEALIQKNNHYTIKDSSQILNRQVDFGCRQIVYEIEVYYKGEIYFGSHAILITRNDTIIFGKLQLLNYDDKVVLNSNFKEDKNAISQYLVKHKELYKLKLKSKDFKKELSREIIFGFGCSFSGSFYPKEAKRMLKYVASKDQKSLSKLVRHLSPELQAYGACGLLRLERNGYILASADLNIIEHLKKRNSKINSCSGCIYGVRFDFTKVISLEND
jgi:hypothetical protein